MYILLQWNAKGKRMLINRSQGDRDRLTIVKSEWHQSVKE